MSNTEQDQRRHYVMIETNDGSSYWRLLGRLGPQTQGNTNSGKYPPISLQALMSPVNEMGKESMDVSVLSQYVGKYVLT